MSIDMVEVCNSTFDAAINDRLPPLCYRRIITNEAVSGNSNSAIRLSGMAFAGTSA
jgi:hypothetical protein